MSDTLDALIGHHFAGKVVRKDLTKLIKGNAIVPTYVLEYLLGQYCATTDEATIQQGVESVKNIIAQHFVHRDEAQLVKSRIRERGQYRLIDKVGVRLNDKRDQYEGAFTNLSLKGVPVSDAIVRQHPKLLSGGVWCIVNMGYQPTDEKDASPWIVQDLKPIQISQVDVQEYCQLRAHFSTQQWTDLLLQSIGLNPAEFTDRGKLLQLCRLIPFVENNYNMVELGPKGTGKSHVFSEMSPHGILISGGEVTKAKLFVNNATGELGLVGYWDVVAYDEFAGRGKKVDQGLVDILKNYMANKSFSRGTEVHGASASMAFVGNTDHSVPYMLRHSHLFEALPKDYQDTAFLDRMHLYLPGWEVEKLRNEMFTAGYGFIVDYLAEVLKELRKQDHAFAYEEFFELSDTITTRDKTAIGKTFSGLLKLLFPHGQYGQQDVLRLLCFAIEGRRRVKEQLQKMDPTFEEVLFAYRPKGGGAWTEVHTQEVLDLHALEHTHDQGWEQLPDPGLSTLPEQLPETYVELRDGQRAVSWSTLLGPYLRGAARIALTDPYIRQPYQFRNLMELLALLLRLKPEGEPLHFHLFTHNEPEFMDKARERLETIKELCLSQELHFTFSFDPTAHDRILNTDTGWSISLGRGLDIYQKTDGANDPLEYMPERRACKACRIVYSRRVGEE